MSMSCLMSYLRHREVICERILVKCTATNFAIGICLQPLRPYFILLHYIISGLLNKMGLDWLFIVMLHPSKTTFSNDKARNYNDEKHDDPNRNQIENWLFHNSTSFRSLMQERSTENINKWYKRCNAACSHNSTWVIRCLKHNRKMVAKCAQEFSKFPHRFLRSLTYIGGGVVSQNLVVWQTLQHHLLLASKTRLCITFLLRLWISQSLDY